MNTIVIKIGSNIVADERAGLNTERIAMLAGDISELQDKGFDVVVVSSGAIAAGMKKLGFIEKPKDIRLKQAAASVGQSSLMWAYENGFAEHGKKVAQILLTRDDFSDRKRFINAKNTFLSLLGYRIIPIVNENDTVSTDEIKFGDNDHLASLVGSLVEAAKLIILSDVDGLFTADPKQNTGAELIDMVPEITAEIEKKAGGAGSIVGTGGMYSKIIAAKRAVRYGMTVHIISGKKKGLLGYLLSGNNCGTVFTPAKKLSSRKGWIAYGSRSRGNIIIDQGAVKAIVERGKSLLPSGILMVEGTFDIGDAVSCLDQGKNRIAKGLTNYASSELKKIRGKKTAHIEDILGYKYSDEVIHRNNLVLL